jgi:cell volume regulation protein A
MQAFGLVAAVVSGAVLAALAFRRGAERLRIPAPVVFLVGAAAASDVVDPLRNALSPREVGWIASAALIVILFDGGVSLGWSRVRPIAGIVVTLGLGATVLAAAVIAVAAHLVASLGWATSAVLGVALAPTDPAVVFSVMQEGRLADRPKAILEAESGANDPIAIALMVGVIASSVHGHAWVSTVGATLVRELAIGLLVGLMGAWLIRVPLRHLTDPRETLQPIVALSGAGLIFGVAAALHGSGFLAVFVAGLLLGDADVQVGEDVRAFHSELASLAEVVVFVALGLTVHLASLGPSVLLGGVALTVVLLTLARVPAVVGLLLPTSIPLGERLFLAWAGLRGAVPILLASLALVAGLNDARKVYGLVFVVVSASVLVQGVTLPTAARRLGLDDPGDSPPAEGS